MKIAVMGTGAMGGYVGARLASVGADVTFIARGAHLAAIQQDGLCVTSPLGDLHIAPAQATDDPATVGPVDLILLGVKLYDVEAAVKAVKPMLGEDTGVVTLQNGVDAPSIVADIAGPSHSVPGVALINGEIVAPGVIQHNAMNGVTLGESDGRASDRLEKVAALGRESGLDVTVSPDIRLELWRKFLLLSPMAGLSALTRVPLAGIRETPSTWALAEAAMKEVIAVANAEGVGLGQVDLTDTLSFVQTGMPPTWQASLTVDLELGKRLEVEWLQGTVCRLAEKHGIAVPIHQVFTGTLMPHAMGKGA